MLVPLPIDPHIDRILRAVDSCGSAVVVAPPGSGKTTRVPPALAAGGRTILLQPRKIAARSIARRIAVERGWEPGREVGWQVRFERRFTRQTNLLVATEGILTARLQSDPLLEEFRTVVLDEFHERSLHADLALALVRQAARARGDLRIVVMSATLDAAPVAEFLDDCPIVEVPGRPFPVEIGYAPHETTTAAIRRRLDGDGGHILCFLPGAPEIRRLQRKLGEIPGVRILPLHGSLEPSAQDAALARTDSRKLILATNLAETSLTVDGVTDVIDSGTHKVLRRDPSSGIDRLETERISLDSAEQRSGRAGRTGPGHAVRLWDPRDRLRAHREPEIQRVDLAGPFLEILAWGDHPAEFDWFEAPPGEATASALELLERLGAVSDGKITPLGKSLRRFPMHPRLSRVLLAAGGSAEAVAACTVLAERWSPPGPATATDSDILAFADRIAEAPHHVRATARQIERQLRELAIEPGTHDEVALRRAIIEGYPDRVARRRRTDGDRLVLASGHGAVLTPDSGVRRAEFLVALDVQAGSRGPGSEARVRSASAIEREWLTPTRSEVVHTFDIQANVVRALERSYYDKIVLAERDAPVDPEEATRILVDTIVVRGLSPSNEASRRRIKFAGLKIDLRRILSRACAGRTSVPNFDLLDWLPFETRRDLDRLAPTEIAVPSGRKVRLEYREDGEVVASVKLQELFGLAATPNVGPAKTPLTLSLLAPNGRPVQTTRDLASFWNRTYPEVRKELRGRYPKHPWPEDPWSAEPTARIRRRKKN